MKLNQEGVEKAEAAMALANPYSETYAEDRVIAALTAYFDYLREAGLMREAGWYSYANGYHWEASTGLARDQIYEGPDYDSAFILRAEKE